MVDALDSKSNAVMCVGSSPTSGTNFSAILKLSEKILLPTILIICIYNLHLLFVSVIFLTLILNFFI